jgi:hypothetical protein
MTYTHRWLLARETEEAEGELKGMQTGTYADAHTHANSGTYYNSNSSGSSGSSGNPGNSGAKNRNTNIHSDSSGRDSDGDNRENAYPYTENDTTYTTYPPNTHTTHTTYPPNTHTTHTTHTYTYPTPTPSNPYPRGGAREVCLLIYYYVIVF